MRENFDHIDATFGSAASEMRAPEYDPAFWQEMEQLLAANRRRKKGFVWISLSGSLVLSLLIFALFSINQSVPKYNASSLEIEKDHNVIGDDFTPNVNKKAHRTIALNMHNSPLYAKEYATDIGTFEFIPEPFSSDIIPSNSRDTEFALTLPFSQMHLFAIEEDGILLTPELGNFIQTTASQGITFSIFTGGGIGQTYTNEGYSKTLFAGINSTHHFNKKLSLSVGLGIQKEFHPGIAIHQRSMVYNFGVTNFEHQLSYRNFTEILVPIEVAVNTKAGKLGLGIQSRVLNQTKMDFHAFENDIESSSDVLYGRTEGLRALDADIFFTYSQEVSNKMALGLKVSQPIMGRINDSQHFADLSNTRTLQAQVQLTYRIGK